MTLTTPSAFTAFFLYLSVEKATRWVSSKLVDSYWVANGFPIQGHGPIHARSLAGSLRSAQLLVFLFQYCSFFDDSAKVTRLGTQVKMYYMIYLHSGFVYFLLTRSLSLLLISILFTLSSFIYSFLYRVFFKKVLHKREEKMQEKNKDDRAERWKFGTSTTTM